MDLEYLSGTDDDYSDEEMGRLFKRKKPAGDSGQKKGGIKKFISDTKKDGIKTIVRKAAHIANRANPATLLLRNGVLICMKLNLMKVAQRLKYAYMSDTEAQKRGVDMGRFQKLKQVMQKLEQIFYGAGGKPENLKKAILTGRGNRNKAVSVSGVASAETGGLGYTDVGESDYSINKSTPLPHLLGEDIYNSEMEGLGEAALGEPVSAAASITAATGAIGSIALLLKSIGSLFPKRAKESEDFENTETASEDLPAEIEENKEEIARMKLPDTPEENKGKNPADDNSGKNPSEEEDSPEENKGKKPSESFWDNNKNWLKPTLIGVTGVGLLYLGYRAITGQKKEQATSGLSGTKTKKKNNPQKKEIELM